MNRQIIVLSVIILSMFLAGCAGSRNGTSVSGSSAAGTPVFVSDLAMWPQQYRQNFERMQSFRGDARLTVESETFGGNVDLETLWESPNKLFLKAEGPLGLDIGKIFVGEDRFVWYNQYENHFTSGNLSDPYLNRFLQTNITLEDLKYTVLGFAGQIIDSVKMVDNTHGIFQTISPKDDEIYYRFIVNPESGLLETVEALRQGRAFMRQDFKNYRVVDGVFIPGIVQITMLDQRERISIFYKKVAMNKPLDPSEYTIEISGKVEQLNVN